MILDGDASTVALSHYMVDINKKYGVLLTEISDLEAQRAAQQTELDNARDRLALIKECKVDKDIADCHTQLEEEKETMAKFMAEVKECEAELGDHKAQLHLTFEKMHQTSLDMHHHVKLPEDTPEHTSTLEEGIKALDDHLAIAKAACLKRQQQHRAQKDHDDALARDQDCRRRLEEYETQKRNEEEEAARLQADFERQEKALSDLDAELAAKYKHKAELDTILDETKKAHERIEASCQALLDVCKRESILLNRQAKCTKQLPPNMLEDARKLMDEFGEQLERERLQREVDEAEEKARLKYLEENPPPPEPEPGAAPKAKGKAKAKSKK